MTLTTLSERQLASREPLPEPVGDDWVVWAQRLIAVLDSEFITMTQASAILPIIDSQGRTIVDLDGIYGYDAFGAIPISPDIVQIDTQQLVDAAIITSKLANLSVETTKIANLAVGTAQMALLAVTSAIIGDLAVVTAKIDDLAVNSAKIANLAVGSAKIDALAVTQAKIALLAVDRGQIANTLESDDYNDTTKVGIKLHFDTGLIEGQALIIYNTDGIAVFSSGINPASPNLLGADANTTQTGVHNFLDKEPIDNLPLAIGDVVGARAEISDADVVNGQLQIQFWTAADALISTHTSNLVNSTSGFEEVKKENVTIPATTAKVTVRVTYFSNGADMQVRYAMFNRGPTAAPFVTAIGGVGLIDQINAGNISTYIANVAIQTAQIANLAVGTAQIANLAVDTAQIATLAVTDAKINDLAVNKLTAGTIDVAITMAEEIIINTLGNIRGGQTAFDTGDGFWLGYDGAYKFSIGNAGVNRLAYDGTDLLVRGANVYERDYTAGNNVQLEMLAEVTDLGAGAGTYLTAREWSIHRFGVLRVTFDFKVDGGTGAWRLFQGSTVLDEETGLVNTTYVGKTVDTTLDNPDDPIKLQYATGVTDNVFVQNVRVKTGNYPLELIEI